MGRGAKLPSGLTVRREQFADLVGAGVEPFDAYTQAGFSARMGPAAIRTATWKMLKDPKIQQRIAEIREQAKDRVLLSLEEHLENLRQIATEARAAGQYGAAAAAEKSRGQAIGHYVVRTREEGKLTIVIQGKDAKA